ncbi:hypothetical protein CC86DRAFT_204979 [Ophiobolus disseminans]|uniref:Uncharacterized protein n=1 Tax=Ophiobolus disseminans TaxID=1469910 RepID=A0A6A7A5Y8_9PLEO|nr:hypothetical protein CC86DRAFT_204979 [Ophiobolus disseminans]
MLSGGPVLKDRRNYSCLIQHSEERASSSKSPVDSRKLSEARDHILHYTTPRSSVHAFHNGVYCAHRCGGWYLDGGRSHRNFLDGHYVIETLCQFGLAYFTILTFPRQKLHGDDKPPNIRPIASICDCKPSPVVIDPACLPSALGRRAAWQHGARYPASSLCVCIIQSHK